MKTFTTVAACLSVSALVGCGGHTHNLVVNENKTVITAGKFLHERTEGPAMVLEFQGESFEARDFVIRRKQDLVDLRRQYGSSRHYDRIFSGLDSDHYVYSAEPMLRSKNGAVLQCAAVWRAGGLPAGYCLTTTGNRVNFQFE